MPGYLLDTNHVGAACSKEPRLIGRLKALPSKTQVRTCVITLGEVEASHRINQTTNQAKRDAYVAELEAHFAPSALAITSSTRVHYAEVLWQLRQKYSKAPNTKTERWLVVQCGIDINDVWIVSVALEHGLTLLTTDTDVQGLQAILSRLKVDCWLPSSSPASAPSQPSAQLPSSSQMTASSPAPSHPSGHPAVPTLPPPGSSLGQGAGQPPGPSSGLPRSSPGVP